MQPRRLRECPSNNNQVFTWGNFTVNYYQDETSGRFRPSQLRNPAKRPQIEAAVKASLISWWVYRLGYGIALGFVKLSILFFYRAIASQVTFRRLVNTTIGFVCLYTFASTVASIFQCEKPSDSWNTTGYFNSFDRNPKTKPQKFKCYDPIRLWVFSAAVNLLTDVIILLLPIPALLSLRVPMSKRLALVGIFSIGIMAIVASSVRMWVMFLWSESPWNSTSPSLPPLPSILTPPRRTLRRRPPPLGPSRNQQRHNQRLGALPALTLRAPHKRGPARRYAA